MSYTNSANVQMYNFANESYLKLLQEILEFFNSRKDLEFLGFDDTIIRYDEQSKYIASVYILQ